jgi:membrane-bound lytic murein transglycosylase B
LHAPIVRQFEPRREGCGAIRSLTERRPLAAWAALGVRLPDGARLPAAEIDASLVLTEDDRRFLVYRDYEAILGYNCSHYYALSVAMLADRIADRRAL